jgi:ribonuclease VapC
MVIESRKGEAGGHEGRHPAGLNYGDCFAYALAKSRRARLLFTGNDFARTDIERVPLV